MEFAKVKLALKFRLHTFPGCAAYTEGCAAYAEGCAAYAQRCAPYSSEKNIDSNTWLNI